MTFSGAIQTKSRVPTFSKVTNKVLLLSVNIGTLVLFLVLLYFSQASSPYVEPARVAFAILGPTLTFLFYISLPLWAFSLEFRTQSFRLGFIFVILGGVIGVMFALSVNTRAILLPIILLEFGIDPELAGFIFSAVLVPFIEEFAKFFPVYIVGRLTILNEYGKEHRLVNNPLQLLYFGLITGAVFNILETYLYTWNVGYVFQTDDPLIWFATAFQIVLRSLNPLHLLASMLSTLGLLYVLYNSPESSVGSRQNFVGWIGYLAAVILHGLWNGAAVLTDRLPGLIIYDVQISWINILLLISSLIVVFGIILVMMYYSPSFCDNCGLWHDNQLHNNKSNAYLKISLLGQILKGEYRCTTCSKIHYQSTCPQCNSTELYRCEGCYHAVPVYERTCWNCKRELKPIYDDILKVSTPYMNEFSRGVMLVILGSYIPVTLYLIFIIPEFYSNRVYSDFVLIQVLLFTIFSSVLLSIYLLASRKRNQALGVLLSRFVISIVLIQLSITFIAFGFLGNFITILLGVVVGGMNVYMAVVLLNVEGNIIRE